MFGSLNLPPICSKTEELKSMDNLEEDRNATPIPRISTRLENAILIFAILLTLMLVGVLAWAAYSNEIIILISSAKI